MQIAKILSAADLNSLSRASKYHCALFKPVSDIYKTKILLNCVVRGKRIVRCHHQKYHQILKGHRGQFLMNHCHSYEVLLRVSK